MALICVGIGVGFCLYAYYEWLKEDNREEDRRASQKRAEYHFGGHSTREGTFETIRAVPLSKEGSWETITVVPGRRRSNN